MPRHSVSLRAVALLTVAQLVFGSTLASAAGGSGLVQEGAGAQGGSEYVSGNYPGAILMPVNLWGAIGRPGIHHVPTQTDLVTLLSLAGGPSTDAELDHIIIKRRSGSEEQVLRVDAQEMLEKPGKKSPTLSAHDIVVVPRDTPWISSNTTAVIGVLGGILGIVLAGVALNNNFKNK
jgi:hypothetical protein